MEVQDEVFFNNKVGYSIEWRIQHGQKMNGWIKKIGQSYMNACLKTIDIFKT